MINMFYLSFSPLDYPDDLIYHTYSLKILLFSIDISFNLFNGINFALNSIRCFCFSACDGIEFDFGFVKEGNMFIKILFESAKSIKRFFDFCLTATDFIFTSLPSIDKIANID